jgi:3-oxoacyl-[acyl-carrier-protein] synthase III
MTWTTTRTLAVLGTGRALPGAAVETEALIATMTKRFGFARHREARIIADRLAISSRHLCRDFAARDEDARDGDANPDLAARAVAAALDDAGLGLADLAYLIGHTATPLRELPANIALVADQLGYRGPHVELRQACTGFANALMIAHGLIAMGSGAVAIVGSETGSLFFDPHDLDDTGQLVNMMQMGDGAGAIIVGAHRPGGATIEASWYGATGLDRAPGIARDQRRHRFEHDFGAIRASGHQLFEAGAAAARSLGLDIVAARHVIPHQVSGRIGALAARHFGLSEERIAVEADRTGNTGSAAIWIALAALRPGLAAGDDVVVLGAEASKFMFGGFAYRHG